MVRGTFLLLAVSAVPLFGQTPAASPTLRSNVDYARLAWRETRSNLLQAALDAPDSVFVFRPGPEVRSFGETLDHVAASQNGYCLMALGERPTGSGAGTGARTKAEVIAALRASNAACESAYAQSDAAASQPAFGGGRDSRLHVLLMNVSHNSEHYGNIVTYLRLHGIVPPSSRSPAP